MHEMRKPKNINRFCIILQKIIANRTKTTTKDYNTLKNKPVGPTL